MAAILDFMVKIYLLWPYLWQKSVWNEKNKSYLFLVNICKNVYLGGHFEFRPNIVIFFVCCPVKQVIPVFVPKTKTKTKTKTKKPKQKQIELMCVLCWKYEFLEVLDTLADILFF